MGITGKAMPLLSTIAALVIIVNSAEELADRGLEREYRYDLRPRALDTPVFNDEPWKIEDGDQFEEFPEQSMKRPKLGRKRKRRIHAEASEDKPLMYRDTQYNHEPKSEVPRRRRKRPENRRNRWTEEYADENIDSPLTKRIVKRKQPSEDKNYRFTEFDEFRVGDNIPKLSDYLLFPEPDEIYPKEEMLLTDPPHSLKSHKAVTVNYMHLSNDRSLSEFSGEVVDTRVEPSREEVGTEVIDNNNDEEYIEDQKQYDSKNSAYNDAASKLLEKKIREDRPINPVTLKEILKRSNGTSLSEILQQYNLSLSDLLRGKEDRTKITKNIEESKKVIGIPKKEHNQTMPEQVNEEYQEIKEVIVVSDALTDKNAPIQKTESNPNKLYSLESNETTINKPNDLESQSTSTNTNQQNNKDNYKGVKILHRRGPSGIRRKLRFRPSNNGPYKSQLNRDLMAQTARKYHNSRNITKSKEWKYIIPMMMNLSHSSEEVDNKNEMTTAVTTTITTNSIPEETTTIQNLEYYSSSSPIDISSQNDSDKEEIQNKTIASVTATEINIQTEADDEDDEEEEDEEEKQTTEDKQTVTMTTTQETITYESTTQEITTTKTPKVSRLRPSTNRMGLRRQAFNHRLKRKRMKQKTQTTEPPVQNDESFLNLFGMPNLVSSSEFIARTQTPKPAHIENMEVDFTTLDDFMTTERSNHAENGPRFTRNSSVIHLEDDPTDIAGIPQLISTTEETAKFEIEEILNDTRTSARLSRILMERNMTLNELVEHRERGSSHVHLADIFHNASKEPNPPEPFLSKSSIEPISRETYPLRAILEANLHDSAGNGKTNDPMSSQSFAAGNIPVVMDFGNNVNENGENMGIMSLFNKFTEDINNINESTIGKDSEGTPYVTTVITVNNTDTNDTKRESRVMKNEENSLKLDALAWTELFQLMKKHHQNETGEVKALDKGEPSSHQILLEDADGDGLIALEDLQRLKDFDVNNEVKLDINSYEADSAIPGILDRSPSHSRSVTVATASIVGLAMILFLLTYAAFKWKQQRKSLRKKQNFSDDRIPTPVFEKRKGHKHNLSTRSISPMLATSNIYTLNTLDSSGKESPDYMWDSLRKPFQ